MPRATPPDAAGGPTHPLRRGRYEILEKLAAGGMAEVYLARASGAAGFERRVALKACHPHLREDEDFVAMFLDEARLAATIHHPNVVATLDVSEVPLFLVMEYIDGGTFAGLIRAAARQGTRLPVPVVLRVTADALAGLHAAHELRDRDGRRLNLVHRDISPQNVLVGRDGVARIADFGVAKAEARASVTRDGALKGKVAYMAAELFDGAAASPSTDIWSAGVVLWEALTGQRLFVGATEGETVRKVMFSRPPAPSSIVPVVPPALDAVVARALARAPGERFATAAEFADALERCEGIGRARDVAATVDALLGPPRVHPAHDAPHAEPSAPSHAAPSATGTLSAPARDTDRSPLSVVARKRRRAVAIAGLTLGAVACIALAVAAARGPPSRAAVSVATHRAPTTSFAKAPIAPAAEPHATPASAPTDVRVDAAVAPLALRAPPAHRASRVVPHARTAAPVAPRDAGRFVPPEI